MDSRLDGDGLAFFLDFGFGGCFKGFEAEEKSGNKTAEARQCEEEPELRERLTSGKQGGAKAAGWVDAGAGDVDSDEVYGDEGDADREAG